MVQVRVAVESDRDNVLSRSVKATELILLCRAIHQRRWARHSPGGVAHESVAHQSLGREGWSGAPPTRRKRAFCLPSGMGHEQGPEMQPGSKTACPSQPSGETTNIFAANQKSEVRRRERCGKGSYRPRELSEEGRPNVRAQRVLRLNDAVRNCGWHPKQ